MITPKDANGALRTQQIATVSRGRWIPMIGICALGLLACPIPLPQQSKSSSSQTAGDNAGSARRPLTSSAELAAILPQDVTWILEIARPDDAQRSLSRLLEAWDGAGRLLDGATARLTKKIGISPTSRLLWRGTGIDATRPLLVAQRSRVGGGSDTLISLGVSSSDRFLASVASALGDDVALGPRLLDVATFFAHGKVIALARITNGNAVVWLDPADPVSNAALLSMLGSAFAGERTAEGHPLFRAEIEAAVSSARAGADPSPRGVEVAVWRAGARAAHALSDTALALVAPVPFVAGGGVVRVDQRGDWQAQVALNFATDDIGKVTAPLLNSRAPSIACALDDDAAVFASFPVALGLDPAREQNAPLPAPDRLTGGAAIALYPRSNTSRKLAAAEILRMGAWAFAATPRDDDGRAALELSLKEGGMTQTREVAGKKIWVAAPPDGDTTRTLEAVVSPDAMVLALGQPPTFEAALLRDEKHELDADCSRVFAPLTVRLDGNALTLLGLRAGEGPLGRLASSVGATVSSAGVRVAATATGVLASLSANVRPSK